MTSKHLLGLLSLQVAPPYQDDPAEQNKTKTSQHGKTIQLSECCDLMCVTELRDATVYDVEATSQKKNPQCFFLNLY